MKNKISSLLVAAIVCAAIVQTSNAKQGATDPIPGTSKGGTSTGGSSGGGKTVTPTPTPTPTPPPTPAPAPQPIISAPLTFSSSGAVSGNCTGSYHIDPYYPTLSLLTVTVKLDSMSVPDNSYYSVNVVTTGGTAYPFTSNIISVVGQTGTVNYSIYVTPGTTVAGVTVCDASGVIDFAGN